MNLVTEYMNVVKRINSVEGFLEREPDDNQGKAAEFLLKAFGESDETLEVELEGLLITKAWLEDTLGYYVEEKGFSMDKSFKHIIGEDYETQTEEQKKENE